MENKIIQGDCIEQLKLLPENSVDAIVTDPPYNISIDEWDKFKDEEYIRWSEKWIDECIRVLKKNGSFYIFGDFRFIGDIKVLMNKKNVLLKSWLIWDKGTKAQNSTRSFINVTEHILFYINGIEKDKGIPTEINKVRDYLREEKKKSGLSNKDFNLMFSNFYNKIGCRDRSVIEHYFSEMQWTFPSKEIYEKILQTTGYFKKDYEDLLREYKSLTYTFNIDDIRIKRNPKDKRKFKNEKQLVPNIFYLNVKDEMAKINHPTPKPLELIENFIKVSTNEQDLVLDPFLGSGTTAIASLKLGRKFIGIEKEEEYIKIAEARINAWNEKLHPTKGQLKVTQINTQTNNSPQKNPVTQTSQTQNGRMGEWYAHAIKQEMQ